METILCKCGCKQLRPRFDNKGRERFYINGHGGKQTQFQRNHEKSKLEKNSRWRGGKATNPKGYVLLKRLDHPSANSHGYVFEHRLIMEKHIGRYLTKNEIVHHINGNRKDNRIENLKLMLKGSHSIHHNIGEKRAKGKHWKWKNTANHRSRKK